MPAVRLWRLRPCGFAFCRSCRFCDAAEFHAGALRQLVHRTRQDGRPGIQRRTMNVARPAHAENANGHETCRYSNSACRWIRHRTRATSRAHGRITPPVDRKRNSRAAPIHHRGEERVDLPSSQMSPRRWRVRCSALAQPRRGTAVAMERRHILGVRVPPAARYVTKRPARRARMSKRNRSLFVEVIHGNRHRCNSAHADRGRRLRIARLHCP